MTNWLNTFWLYYQILRFEGNSIILSVRKAVWLLQGKTVYTDPTMKYKKFPKVYEVL